MIWVSCNCIFWNWQLSKIWANYFCLGCIELGFLYYDFKKGSVFKMLKYFGFFLQDMFVGINKLVYYSCVGFEKVMSMFENVMGVNKEYFEILK